ncbi:hypothetical protein [Streptomyces sp. MMS24-I29]
MGVQGETSEAGEWLQTILPARGRGRVRAWLLTAAPHLLTASGRDAAGC